jgi:hypothetical protein
MPQSTPTLRVRINVLDPPRDVTFRAQRGRDVLVEPASATVGRVTFDLEFRVGSRPGGLPNFLGEFVQGPPAARFVYINSGTYAGQAASPWARRARGGGPCCTKCPANQERLTHRARDDRRSGRVSIWLVACVHMEGVIRIDEAGE